MSDAAAIPGPGRGPLVPVGPPGPAAPAALAGRIGPGRPAVANPAGQQARARPLPVSKTRGRVWIFLAYIGCFVLNVYGIQGVMHQFNTARWGALAGIFFFFAVTRKRSGVKFPYAASLFLFLCLVSSLGSVAVEYSSAKLLPGALTIILCFYLLPRVMSLQDLKHLFTLLSVSFLFLVFLSFLAGLRSGTFFSGRYGSLFSNPNSEGLYAGFCVTSCLWLYHEYAYSRWRNLLFWSFFLNGAILYATGSRSSFFAAIAASGVWMSVQLARTDSARSQQFIRLGLILALIFMIGRGFSVEKWNSLTRGFSKKSFLSSREKVWRDSYEAFLRKPVFGHGYGISEKVRADTEVRAKGIGSVRDGAGYFALLESVGIVGSAAFALLIFLVGRSVRQLMRMRVYSEAAMLAYACATCSTFLVINLVGEPWIVGPGNPTYQIFWLYLGMTAYLTQMAKGQVLSRRSRTENLRSTLVTRKNLPPPSSMQPVSFG